MYLNKHSIALLNPFPLYKRKLYRLYSLNNDGSSTGKLKFQTEMYTAAYHSLTCSKDFFYPLTVIKRLYKRREPNIVQYILHMTVIILSNKQYLKMLQFWPIFWLRFNYSNPFNLSNSCFFKKRCMHYFFE